MYTPTSFEPPSTAAMHDLIRACPLATLVTLGADGLCADHLPMHLSADAGTHGVLACHVPRVNRVWQEASKELDAMVVFHGPESYITPSWYATKRETGKVAPTWNYVVVHAHGPIRVIEDAHWIRQHLESLTGQQEAPQPLPWAVSDAPPDYVASMIASLVGIEIPISKLVGKWKVSQNRPQRDRAGVVAGLRDLDHCHAAQMAALVEHGTG